MELTSEALIDVSVVMADNGNGNDQDGLASALNSGIVPGFFYELVARIIPGIVVLSICLSCGSRGIECYLNSYWNAALLLIAAWIIGAMLDMGCFGLGFCCRKFVERFCPPKCVENFCRLNIGASSVFENNEFLKGEPAWIRSLYIKQMAMVIFFRSMSIIGLFTFLWLAIVHPRCSWHSGHLLHCRHWCPPLLALVLFMLSVAAWYAENCSLKQAKVTAKENRDKAQNKQSGGKSSRSLRLVRRILTKLFK